MGDKAALSVARALETTMNGPGELTPERFARLKEILLAALDLPPGKRERYVDLACGGERKPLVGPSPLTSPAPLTEIPNRAPAWFDSALQAQGTPRPRSPPR